MRPIPGDYTPRHLMSKSGGSPRNCSARTDGFYLVDPLGNLMMRYEIMAEPKGVLKDLQRLLKYSALGR